MIGIRFIFQCDNDHKHTAITVKHIWDTHNGTDLLREDYNSVFDSYVFPFRFSHVRQTFILC